jgi:hypothetical protein
MTSFELSLIIGSIIGIGVLVIIPLFAAVVIIRLVRAFEARSKRL